MYTENISDISNILPQSHTYTPIPYPKTLSTKESPISNRDSTLWGILAIILSIEEIIVEIYLMTLVIDHISDTEHITFVVFLLINAVYIIIASLEQILVGLTIFRISKYTKNYSIVSMIEQGVLGITLIFWGIMIRHEYWNYVYYLYLGLAGILSFVFGLLASLFSYFQIIKHNEANISYIYGNC